MLLKVNAVEVLTLPLLPPQQVFSLVDNSFHKSLDFFYHDPVHPSGLLEFIDSLLQLFDVMRAKGRDTVGNEGYNLSDGGEFGFLNMQFLTARRDSISAGSIADI